MMRAIGEFPGMAVEFVPFTGAFMKLAPVLTELGHAVDGVDVVQRGLSTEQIATAVRFSDTELLQSINAAQAEL
jgi:hypothetical protein